MRTAALVYRSLACVLIACGLYLLVAKLALIGLSWDEYMDWGIAESYAQHGSVLSNTFDPSQGRLSHLIAGAFFFVFGSSYFTFKLPFVLIGIAGGVLLCAALARSYSWSIALAVSAYYFTNPYLLGSARSAATAGDICVLVLALAFVLSLDRWLAVRDFWRGGALCAVVCGVAVGAKWTDGIAVPIALIAVVVTQRRGLVIKDILCFLLIMGVSAVAASPTFLLGIRFVSDALAQAHGYDQGTRMYLGEFVGAPQWYFLPAMAAAKLGIPFCAFLLVAIVLACVRRFRAVAVPPLVWISLAVAAPVVLFALKPFQSAYYYVFAFAPCVVLVAWLLAEMESSRPLVAWLFLGAVTLQTAQAFALSPDFLHAGYELGARFEGEFWGPAVNHCQGGPIALAAVPAGARVYVLDDCFPILSFDLAHGPERPHVQLHEYPKTGAPAGPHVVAVNRVFFIEGHTAAEHEQRMARFVAATDGCEEIAAARDPYRLFRCR